MENDLNILSTKSGFNTALRHFKAVTGYVPELSDGTNLADLINEYLKPLGVMVVIEAEHMCMSMRGAKKPKSLTVTSAVRGSFRTHNATRSEAMTLIRGGLSGGREL